MDAYTIFILVFKVVALALGIFSIVLGFFATEAYNKTWITFLGIKLASLAPAALF